VTDSMLLIGLGLLALSIVLIVVEVFVPSGGVIAIVAGIVAISGVVTLFRVSTTWGLAGLLAMVILIPTAVAFGLRIWPYTPVGRRMLMGSRTEEDVERDRAQTRQEREQWQALLGAEGEAMTDLRPVGVVQIDGRRYDALAEVNFIDAGTRVRVTIVDGKQIKVRPLA